MKGAMWHDAKTRFEGQYVRLFVKELTRPLQTSEGQYMGMWTFTGKVTFRENYVVVAPGGEYELWLQDTAIEAISLDVEDEDEDEEPDREIHPGIGKTDWDNAFQWLQKEEELNGSSDARDFP